MSNKLQQWEYDYLDLDPGDAILINLNDYGSIGWELIGIIPAGNHNRIRYIFKRPKIQPQ
jgi:hypothetical protein